MAPRPELLLKYLTTYCGRAAVAINQCNRKKQKWPPQLWEILTIADLRWLPGKVGKMEASLPLSSGNFLLIFSTTPNRRWLQSARVYKFAQSTELPTYLTAARFDYIAHQGFNIIALFSAQTVVPVPTQ
jgi:hypothetical protein